MIIIKIKRKNTKRLLEAPLIDIIDSDSASKSSTIGYSGYKRSPEEYKSDAMKLFERTKTDFVLYFPTEKDLQKLSKAKRVSDFGEPHNTIVIPPWLKEKLAIKNIDYRKVHVLIPMSEALEDDYDSPDWTLVHDMIGHGMGGTLLSRFRLFMRNIPKPTSDKEGSEDDVAREFLRALYSGVPVEFQLGKKDLRDTAKPITPGTLGWQPFNIESPGQDDRLPDIIASIFLMDYDINKSYKYLEDHNLPIAWKENIDKMVATIKEYVKKGQEDINKPGRATLFDSWG